MHRRHGQDSLPGLYQVGDIIDVWPSDLRVLKQPPVWSLAVILKIQDRRAWADLDEANLPPGHGCGYRFHVAMRVPTEKWRPAAVRVVVLSVTGRDRPKLLQYVDIVKLCESRDAQKIREFLDSPWFLRKADLSQAHKDGGWQRYLERIGETGLNKSEA